MPAPRKISPVDTGTKRTVGMPVVTISGTQTYDFSGSFGAFQDFSNVFSLGGGFGNAPSPGYTPRRAVVPPDDDEPSPGESDPSLFPPFPPGLDVGSPGTSEPPEEISDDDEALPSVTVSAPRIGAGSIPFATSPSRPVPKKPARRPVRRRPAKPVRRTRPLRPGPKPRLPINVPELIPEVRVIARAVPYAALLALVPPYLRMLGRIDEYGTEQTLDRMFPPLARKKNARKPDDSLGSGRADPDAFGDQFASPGAARDDLPTLVVSGSRPSPLPPLASLPELSFREPGYIYPPGLPDVGSGLKLRPARRPRKRLVVRPVLDLPRGLSNPNVLQQPFQAPINSPLPKPTPTPSPRPGPSPSPSPIAGPSIAPVSPGITPSPSSPLSPTTGPLPLEHRCSCRTIDPNKKRKPKKKAARVDHAELEVEYKTKYGRVKVEGTAKKYCVKPPLGRRICYTPESGVKLGGASSIASILRKLIRRK